MLGLEPTKLAAAAARSKLGLKIRCRILDSLENTALRPLPKAAGPTYWGRRGTCGGVEPSLPSSARQTALVSLPVCADAPGAYLRAAELPTDS